MTTLQTPLGVVATATTSGTLAAGRHTPVDATAGPLTMTLPTPANVGARLRVEKVDATANTVTVSGTIRGAASTISLVWQYESVELVAESLSSWRPSAGHKTKAGLDATYAQRSANLSDLASASTARSNLGLGGAATLNVGTGAGTVAAGNDSRITGAVQSTQVGAANGVASLDGTSNVPLAQLTAAVSDAASKYAPYVDARSHGAVGDGTTDDRAALAAADAAASTTGAVLLRAGTYRVASALTVSAPVVLQAGAVIKPDNGVTVILAGGCDAPRRQVFDQSAGGVVAPQRVDHYHPAWWGATGGADDTAAWTAMAAAVTASATNDPSTGVNFSQRILAPIGVNRFFGVTLSNCHLIAEKGTSIFYPSGSPTSGSMLTIGDYCTVSGGYWRTNGAGQAINLINYQGFRARVQGVYLSPAVAGSVGLYVGNGPTITPVLTDIQINPTNRQGTGIVLNSADAEMANVWIGNCDIGLNMLVGASRMSNVHIWGCNTGWLSSAADEMEVSGLFLDSNLGWGADLDLADRNIFTNFHVWNNGAGQAGTGGIRLRKSTSGSARDCILTSGVFDDNTGVGLLLDGVTGTEVNSVRFGSRSVQAGNAPVCDTGIRITSAASNVHLKIRGRRTDVITALVDDQSTSTAIDLGVVKKVLTADVPFTANTGITTILGIPVGTNERWLIDGVLFVDGPQTGDVKVRLQGSSITGVTGTFAIPNAPAGSSASTTAVSVNPTNTVPVMQTGGSALAPGLVGVGIIQALSLVGHVVTGSTAGTLDIQAAQQSSDPGTTTIRAGSWLRGVRIA